MKKSGHVEIEQVIFEVLEPPQVVEAIAPANFEASSGLGNIIKKLVLLNFMDMMRSVSVIFYNAYNS